MDPTPEELIATGYNLADADEQLREALGRALRLTDQLVALARDRDDLRAKLEEAAVAGVPGAECPF